MNFEWSFEKNAERNKVIALAKELNNQNRKLVNILVKRGIDTFDKAKEFFRPSKEFLHNPFLMKDMGKAVERLEKALENNEKILVYGDYDVDGTTSVALVYSFLSEITKNIDFYVPDRFTEGYGISTKGIDFAAENEFSLVIALDCGIKAVDKINYANQKNIDFIICDHHTPGEKIPDAIAVLDPKRKDCNYPYKELSGCGVGFKFMQAFAEKNNIDENKVFDLLDILVISIASDIVPITGENRTLASMGLKMLPETKKNSLKAMLKVAGLLDYENQRPVTISDIVFRIGPRINAAGRLEHAKNAVNLLLEKDFDNALEFAKKLDELNSERKSIQEQIVSDVDEIIENKPQLLNKKSFVFYDENWNKGIVGIVASKVIEKYYKPSILLAKSGEKWTGSGRSVENFDLYSAIDKCSHLLHSFGGHKYAAGLTIEDENLGQFIDCFEETVKSMITEDQLVPKLKISEILNFSEIDEKFMSLLEQFAPFGPENMRPVFVTFNVRDTGNSVTMGSKHEHLRLSLRDASGNILTGVAFGMGHLFDDVQKYPFDIAYTLGFNYWQGKKILQMDVKDLRLGFYPVR